MYLGLSHIACLRYLCESDTVKSAMPSPMEKGDRGAVDKGYPGIKESEERRK